ncbi:MAG TPA: alpha/beta fold hydrolase [Actinomycetota bacterium]|nr:alpha/beta fold hydrolase [Actinomycetota bacterium]
MARLERPDGCGLYYEVHGDPRRSPLVLLEGLGGDVAGWASSLPLLAAELFVVAYDLRGNGGSDPPTGPLEMGTFIEDTVALLDELGVERAHVLGISLGGMVAQELALGHPERVRALVLGATHAGGHHVIPSAYRAPKGDPSLALVSEGFAAEHPQQLRERWRGRRRAGVPGAARRQREAIRGFDTYDRLPRITAPTLVIHGTGDRMIDSRNAEVLASRIAGAELVLLKGAGHVFHWEQPERVDMVVLDFLRRHRDA